MDTIILKMLAVPMSKECLRKAMQRLLSSAVAAVDYVVEKRRGHCLQTLTQKVGHRKQARMSSNNPTKLPNSLNQAFGLKKKQPSIL